MTSPTGQNNRRDHPGRRGAFTLVELILVMAIMIAVISLLTPKLSAFFGNRTLNSEVDRFVSLTRLAGSRAVGEGVPMMLWVDSKTGTYGLKQEPGFNDSDPKALDYAVADGLSLDILRTMSGGPAPNSQTARILNGSARGSNSRTTAIYFLPDGTINRGNSIGGVGIVHGSDRTVWIGPSTNGLDFVVQDKNDILLNARR